MAYSNSNISEGGSGCAIRYGDLIDIRQISVNGHDANGQDVYIRMPASDQGMCLYSLLPLNSIFFVAP